MPCLAVPGKQTIPAVTLSICFNQHVERDITFYTQFMIFHLICRAVRWHSAHQIESKRGPVLLEAAEDAWIKYPGPMENLIVDGESGVTSD